MIAILATAGATQFVLARGEELAQGVIVGRTATLAAKRIKLEPHIGNLQLTGEFQSHAQQLAVQRRTVATQHLYAELMRLATGLLALFAQQEHRSHVVKACRTALLIQLVLMVGTHHTGRNVGTQGQLLAVFIVKRPQVPLDQPRHHAGAAHEKIRPLKNRGANLAEPILFGQLRGQFLHAPVISDLRGQQVSSALYRLKHVCKSSVRWRLAEEPAHTERQRRLPGSGGGHHPPGPSVP